MDEWRPSWRRLARARTGLDSAARGHKRQSKVDSWRNCMSMGVTQFHRSGVSPRKDHPGEEKGPGAPQEQDQASPVDDPVESALLP